MTTIPKSCLQCQGQLFQTTYEEQPVSPRLTQIILVGLGKDTCLACGEYEIAFPHYSELMEVVTTAILNKKSLLAPGEIRWLRSCLGLTGEELSRHLGASRTVISYWENGRRDQDPISDRLLRLAVAPLLPAGSFSLSASSQIDAQNRQPISLRLRFAQESGWSSADEIAGELFVQTPNNDPLRPGWKEWLPRANANGESQVEK